MGVTINTFIPQADGSRRVGDHRAAFNVAPWDPMGGSFGAGVYAASQSGRWLANNWTYLGAAGACLGTLFVCAAATGLGFAYRSYQRDGLSLPSRGTVVDGAVTATTFGLGSAVSYGLRNPAGMLNSFRPVVDGVAIGSPSTAGAAPRGVISIWDGLGAALSVGVPAACGATGAPANGVC